MMCPFCTGMINLLYHVLREIARDIRGFSKDGRCSPSLDIARRLCYNLTVRPAAECTSPALPAFCVLLFTIFWEDRFSMSMLTYTSCTLCPRACGVDRTTARGFCGCSAVAHLARAGLHFGEEPPVSGTRGSGAIFFCGCTLRCPYCQNYCISRDGRRRPAPVDADELAALMLDLQANGAHNLIWLPATHYLPTVLAALNRQGRVCTFRFSTTAADMSRSKRFMRWPITSMFGFPISSTEPLKPRQACGALADYPDVALAAITAMVTQAGAPTFADDGTIRRGVIVRHLVLPGGRHDSVIALRRLAGAIDPGMIRLSLMRQYTPPAALTLSSPLNRTVTTFEYRSALAAAAPFDGYTQSPESVGRGLCPYLGLALLKPKKTCERLVARVRRFSAFLAEICREAFAAGQRDEKEEPFSKAPPLNPSKRLFLGSFHPPQISPCRAEYHAVVIVRQCIFCCIDRHPFYLGDLPLAGADGRVVGEGQKVDDFLLHAGAWDNSGSVHGTAREW